MFNNDFNKPLIKNCADCEYGKDEWGVYKNSAEEYWAKVDYKIEKILDRFDIWNEESQNWNTTFVYNSQNTEEYFR